jgi:hypothetical protein
MRKKRLGSKFGYLLDERIYYWLPGIDLQFGLLPSKRQGLDKIPFS